jgi:riboflavin synthase
MFTGIISDVGRLVARNGTRFRIESRYDPADLIEGASIACDGCCLTLARLSEGAGPSAVFEMDVSNETSARTTLGAWTEGTRINLERSLSFGSELGGHLVTGHIDGLARITERRSDGESVRFVLEAAAELAHLIAAKGSIALNGVSLTVNEVEGASFGVNVIPYTLARTTWGDRKPGDLVNLEVDLLARYVERIASGRVASGRDEPRQDHCP